MDDLDYIVNFEGCSQQDVTIANKTADGTG